MHCDFLIIGAGAAGLTAALTARISGLQVIVVEKDAVYGGTTAQSGGFIWIPCNHQAAALGIKDSPALARTYISSEVPGHFDADRVDAFLTHGKDMVELLEKETEVQFTVYPNRPDYHPALPGALTGGRSMAPQTFDGRRLGPHLRTLRHPLPQLTFFGMFLGSAGEVEHYFNVTRSWRSLKFVVRQLFSHSIEMILYKRATRLTRGGALAARLAKSVFDRDIPLLLSTSAESLMKTDGKVTGARVRLADGSHRDIMARGGVLLACGGFTADVLRKKGAYAAFEGIESTTTAASPGSTGDGIRMAEEAGGHLGLNVSTPAAWMPVSIIPKRSGQASVFPHLIDRNKPGMIAVNAQGRRFANEAASYHDFVQAMHRSCRTPDGPKAFLICDQHAIDLYGLGFAKPFPAPRLHHIKSGYLIRAASMQALAQRLDISAEALSQTVENYNAHASQGSDPEFGRGESAYDRSQGDPKQKPNPSLRPLDKPPFYAVRLLSADIATFAGLVTDAQARVLDARRSPIEGLYAAGADAMSVMGGSYPGAGVNLGPAMTFGYIAARQVAQRLAGSTSSRPA